MTSVFDKLAAVAYGDDTPKFLIRQLLESGYSPIDGDADDVSGVFLDPKDPHRVIAIGGGEFSSEGAFLRFAQWAQKRASVSVPKIYSIHVYQCNDEPQFVIEMERLTLSVESDEVVWNDDNLASLCCLWDDTIGASREIFPDKLSDLLFRHYGAILNLDTVWPDDDESGDLGEIVAENRNKVEDHVAEISKANNNDFALVLRELMKGEIVEYAFCEFDFELSSIAVRPGTFELVLTGPK